MVTQLTDPLSRSYSLAPIVARDHFFKSCNDNFSIYGLWNYSIPERRREATAMKIRFISAIFASAWLFGIAVPAIAADGGQSSSDGYAIRHKRGGYSYDKADSVNTYGTNRNKKRHVGPPSFREQTIAGPFDNSFFFDSGVGSIYGGNSPYMH
jgi:hypothetical protein